VTGDEIEGAAEGVLACPVGCAFVAAVERARISAGEAVAPSRAFGLAAAAMQMLRPWGAEHEEAVRMALERGERLGALAHDLVSDADAGWWWDPVDREAQVWLGEEAFPASAEAGVAGSNPRWEGYAERPVGWRVTSTVRDGGSSLEAAVAHGVGDWNFDRVRRGVVEPLGSGLRVFEVNGAEDWHALCVAHPATNSDGSSPAGEGALVPDWASVGAEWDGVHLSFLGVLTTPFVRVSSEVGSSMLWSWGAEQTIWLRPVPGLVDASRLAE
jgi:hypothetical protein